MLVKRSFFIFNVSLFVSFSLHQGSMYVYFTTRIFLFVVKSNLLQQTIKIRKPCRTWPIYPVTYLGGNECACSGIDDSLKIFITEPKEKNRIKKYISQKTGIHLTGFEMIVVDKIPRNETGKVLYSELD